MSVRHRCFALQIVREVRGVILTFGYIAAKNDRPAGAMKTCDLPAAVIIGIRGEVPLYSDDEI